MTNLTKDELIMLAELCGYEAEEDGVHINILLPDLNLFGTRCFKRWKPDENIQQAMECFRALGQDYLQLLRPYQDKPNYWVAKLTFLEGSGFSIEEAICKAVLKALKEKT